MKRDLNPLPILDATLLEEFDKVGIKHLHASHIWRLFIQQGMDLEKIQVSEKVCQVLQKFTASTSIVKSRSDARDGSTTKLLIQLQDGKKIESCIMRYGMVQLEKFPKEELKDSFKSNKRATLCVSSQVGCSMGCTFCATGTMGLVANLSSGEILEQLMHANKIEKIRNVVFMGMGEPLDNYDQVLLAIKAMTDTGRFGLSPSRITISTVGVVPRIRSLIKDSPQIGLALSLHAPNQKLRLKIVPTAKAWNISKIMDATVDFIDNQNKNIVSANRKRHVLVEYVLIDNVNDSEEVAHELGQLLAGKDVYLNVIPYNPTDVPFDYKSPSLASTRKFVDIVKTYGIHTLQRQELGQDIASACGQLVVSSSKCDSVGDLEDFGLSSSRSTPLGKVKKKSKGVRSFQKEWILSIIAALLAWMIIRKL